jgi:O-antigen/teichoic acid export membrane protein
MAAGVNGEIIIMSKFYKVNTYFVVGLAIITIIANYLLIPIYGLEGEALGTVFALFIFNFSKYLFLKVKLKIQPFSLNTIKVLAIGSAVLLIGLYLPKLHNIYFDIIIRSGIVTITYVLVIYFTKASAEINTLVDTWLKRHK